MSRSFKFIATLIATCLVGALTASSASAYAIGTDPFGGGTVNVPKLGPVGVSQGSMTHEIRGEGLNVETQAAVFTAVTPVCNWQIDFAYYDIAGNEYARDGGRLVSDCTLSGSEVGVGPADVRIGTSCAILHMSGAEISRQCHNITEN